MELVRSQNGRMAGWLPVFGTGAEQTGQTERTRKTANVGIYNRSVDDHLLSWGPFETKRRFDDEIQPCLSNALSHGVEDLFGRKCSAEVGNRYFVAIYWVIKIWATVFTSNIVAN
jgi:hypothetical protein